MYNTWCRLAAEGIVTLFRTCLNAKIGMVWNAAQLFLCFTPYHHQPTDLRAGLFKIAKVYVGAFWGYGDLAHSALKSIGETGWRFFLTGDSWNLVKFHESWPAVKTEFMCIRIQSMGLKFEMENGRWNHKGLGCISVM